MQPKSPPPPLKYNKNSGFTLIELSIVLVIIGLIIGGILTGRDLIKSAAVRAQIAQFQAYKTAYLTFKSKYNCIPGDCATASSFALGINGNGNGLLETATEIYGTYTTPDGYFDGEFPQFFIQLGAAGLIDGYFNGVMQVGFGYPTLKINNGFGMIAAGRFQTGGTGTAPDELVSDYGFPPGNFLFAEMCGSGIDLPNVVYPGTANDGCGVMTPVQAYNIDKKIDDGSPLSGQVWGYSSSSFYYCLNNNYSTYNITSDLISCQMSFQLE